MNKFIIQGRITKDLELQTSQGGKEYLKFSVAVNRKFDKDKTDFFNCSAFGNNAKYINQYFKKGDGIIIEGRMENGSYQTQDGTTKYTQTVMVDSWEFPLGKKESTNNSGNTQNQPKNDNSYFDNVADNAFGNQGSESSGFEVADDDLPF